ncbi:MAG: DNA-3-methyladenine glycosylase [Sphingobacteriales bacterium]|nr:DNA-3-methyladenine glycosylase [Sphingobacteriales bacterium]
MKKIPKDFYQRKDVVLIARELLGKELCTFVNGTITSGIITETEAYAGIKDRASHAYNNRFTSRTSVMYEAGGIAYVYLCYGIHKLFNIVTSIIGVPDAVLIRAIWPKRGLDEMLVRRKQTNNSPEVWNGPGKVTQALGISLIHNGISLESDEVWLEDAGIRLTEKDIEVNSRIGVEYAGEDARLPYRFTINPERIL